MVVFESPLICDANIRIKEVPIKSDADVIIYRCQSMGDSDSGSTNWCFSDSPANASLKVFFVDNAADAHLKVYFSPYRADAHWINPFKKNFVVRLHL